MRRVSVSELRVRGLRELSVLADRCGWTDRAREPSDAALLSLLGPAFLTTGGTALSIRDRVAQRARGASFKAFSDRKSTTAALSQIRTDEAERALVAKADRIVAGRFELLGFEGLEFGTPIDWQFDPVSRRRCPDVHWSRIDHLDPEAGGDKKIIWELNRHQWLLCLGRAWWLTGSERYPAFLLEQLSAWMDRNRPGRGVNWSSSIEVSFRAIAWIWALKFFSHSLLVTPEFMLRVLKFLYLHGRHVETYLSTYFSPNTHLTGEALGLVYLGTCFPGFRCSGRWRKTGIEILLREADRQIRSDGVYFEQSSYYHRYTTDFYIHLYVLIRDSQPEVAAAIRSKLLALLEHLAAITRPDGTTPFFGDDDGGRLVVLDERPANDFRAALSTGAVLFGRPDFKYLAGRLAEETVWLLGPSSIESFDALAAEPPSEPSHAFPDGGYYIMRDGWGDRADSLLVDSGPHGSLSGGHAHADALAIEVSAAGRPMLVDPGTFTYTGSAELRQEFRSTVAHNTVTVDGEPSSVPAGPFAWRTVARCSRPQWISQRRFDFFEGSHDGFRRLPDPVTHQRTILFLRGDYWIIRDRMLAEGPHRYDVNFHCAPGVNASVSAGHGASLLSIGNDSSRLDIWNMTPEAAWSTRDGMVSPCYGRQERAPVATLATSGCGPVDLLTILIPGEADDRPAVATGAEAAPGRCIEVRGADWVDLVMAGETCIAGGRTASSDFEWAWLRSSIDGRRLCECVAVGGRLLELEGAVQLRAGTRLNWVSMARSADEIRIEFEPDTEVAIELADSAARLLVNGRTVDR
jgi:hypothetical protein